MGTLNRREWMAICASAVAHAAPAPRSFVAQLYTVRGPLRTDPDRVLKAISDMGVHEVEGYSRADLIGLAPKLRQFGLSARVCPVEAPVVTANWDPFPSLKQITPQQAVDSLAAVGVEFVAMGYIPPGARGDGEDFFRRTADRMNAAAELCRKAGMKFVWQNHAFEFAGRPGLRPYDLYRERIDTKLIGLELDTFWCSMAGIDPLKMLKDWKGHAPIARLNDRAKGSPNQQDENVPLGVFAEAGNGALDFPAILKAAASAGVRCYSVGQDETEGDPIESLRRSYGYLKSLS